MSAAEGETRPAPSAGATVAPGREATSRWLVTAFVAAAWTLPGLVYAVQIFAVGRATDPGLPFARAALHALPSWWIWILVTPLVARLARRVPIGRGHGLRAAAVHLAASLAVALAVLAFAALWFSLTPIRGDRDRSFVEWIWTLTHATTLQVYVFSYWLVVGGTHVIDDERRLRAHEIAAARRETLVTRTRMQVLARQLQPHFLFNALNGISTLILRRDAPAALAMLSSLADFLRATLRVGDAESQPLRAELSLVSQYLAVENARLGDRLAVAIEVGDGAADVAVPVLILQPLVENAVRHGIAAREEGGEVAIRAHREGDGLRIEVTNDSPELPPDWQNRIEQRVGLRNTRARLQEAFGERGRLAIEDDGRGKVRAVIELPVGADGEGGQPALSGAGARRELSDSAPLAAPAPANRDPIPRASARVAAPLVVAAWTLPGLLYAVQLYEIGLRADPAYGFLAALRLALPEWWLWVPLTPLVARLASRLPVRRPNAAGRIAAHLGISLAVALVAVVAQSFLMSTGPALPGIVQSFREWLGSSLRSTAFQLDVFSYWLIVGAVHVVEDERRLRAHEIDASRRAALVARNRMGALARQLQPQFLFSSLDALSTLVVKAETSAALAMLSSLADFLRATIRLGDLDSQPLQAELALVSQYLAVEKALRGDRLTVTIDMDDGAADLPVPVLILQPLVESAVRHGVAARDEGGEVAIRARREGDGLRVEVENDAPERPADWRERLERRAGLRNTRARLREIFGEGTSLAVEDAGRGRLRTVVHLPASRVPTEVPT